MTDALRDAAERCINDLRAYGHDVAADIMRKLLNNIEHLSESRRLEESELTRERRKDNEPRT